MKRKSNGTTEVKLKDGRWVHQRVTGKHLGSYSKAEKLKTDEKRKRPGKFRYLYPLDEEMREKVEPLAKPYPKEEDIK